MTSSEEEDGSLAGCLPEEAVVECACAVVKEEGGRAYEEVIDNILAPHLGPVWGTVSPHRLSLEYILRGAPTAPL